MPVTGVTARNPKTGDWEVLEEENIDLPAQTVALAPISETSELIEVISDDTKQYNQVLKNICHAWKKVTTIDQVCKLALVQTKVLADRRRALNMQLGKEQDNGDNRYLKPWGTSQ